MKKLFIILFLIPIAAFSQKDSVLSGAYKWSEPVAVKENKISSTVLLEGKIHDFEWMQLTANNLNPSPVRIKQTVPKNEEHLIIIKSGTLQVGFGDSTFALNAGSVAVLMPGEKILLNSTQPCSFYRMKYRSKAPKDLKRGKKSGGSFVKFWEVIPFVPNNNGGGRRDFFNKPTAMQKRFEMHVTTLKEGLKSHEPHTHRAEEIVLLLEGETEMQLGDGIVKTGVGGFYYLGSNVSHAIKNIGTKPSTYFAFQFE